MFILIIIYPSGFGCLKLQCHVISGGPKKPVIIEICDDDDACIWCDDDEKPSLKSNSLGSCEPGMIHIFVKYRKGFSIGISYLYLSQR